MCSVGSPAGSPIACGDRSQPSRWEDRATPNSTNWLPLPDQCATTEIRLRCGWLLPPRVCESSGRHASGLSGWTSASRAGRKAHESPGRQNPYVFTVFERSHLRDRPGPVSRIRFGTGFPQTAAQNVAQQRRVVFELVAVGSTVGELEDRVAWLRAQRNERRADRAADSCCGPPCSGDREAREREQTLCWPRPGT